MKHDNKTDVLSFLLNKIHHQKGRQLMKYDWPVDSDIEELAGLGISNLAIV